MKALDRCNLIDVLILEAGTGAVHRASNTLLRCDGCGAWHNPVGSTSSDWKCWDGVWAHNCGGHISTLLEVIDYFVESDICQS